MTHMPSTPPVAPHSGTPNQPHPVPARKTRNVLALIALIVSIVGFIFACIPGALIIGWVLLPIAFILALVSLFMRGQRKGLGIAALIVAVVGTIIGFVVFFAVVASSFDEAFGSDETSVSVPDDAASDAGDSAAAPALDEGTRENPLPVGASITQGDWVVTINSVDLDANQAVADSNQFNEAAPEGSAFILVHLTATYTGNEPSGKAPLVSVDYVTPAGNTVSETDTLVVAPEPFDITTTLYEGASTSGNIALAVPLATLNEGVLAVAPSMFGDKVFVAVQ